MTDRLEDSLADAWKECWNHFYSIHDHNPVGQPPSPPAKVVDSYPHATIDVLNPDIPSFMHSNDKLVSFEHIDPSRYSTTSFVFTGGSGAGFCLADLNFRVAGLFEYVPKWLPEVQKADALKQDMARWDMRKQRITADGKALPRAMMAMIERLANDSLAGLLCWFQVPAFSLTRRFTVFAGKVTKQAAHLTWTLAGIPFVSALVGISNQLARLVFGTKSLLQQASGVVQGWMNWCGRGMRRLADWLRS